MTPRIALALQGNNRNHSHSNGGGVQRGRVPPNGAMAFVGLLLALVAAGQAQATPPKDALDLGDKSDVRGLAVSPDGQMLAVQDNRKGEVTLWEVKTKKQTAVLRPKDWRPYGQLAFTPDGSGVVMCGAFLEYEKGAKVERWSVHIWDVATQKEHLVLVLPEGARGDYVLTPDGKSLIIGTADQGILVFSLESGKQTKTLPCANEPKNSPVGALAVSPDGKTLAAGRRGVLLLFDLEKGDLLRRIEAPKELVENDDPTRPGVVTTWDKVWLRNQRLEDWPNITDLLAFSPDGKQLVSAAAQASQVLVWDLATGKSKRILRFTRSEMVLSALAFSPDGATLALGGAGVVEFWDVGRFGYRGDSPGLSRSGDELRHLVFTPDGKTLITASNRVEFWDVPTGAPKSVRYPKVMPVILSPTPLPGRP